MPCKKLFKKRSLSFYTQGLFIPFLIVSGLARYKLYQRKEELRLLGMRRMNSFLNDLSPGEVCALTTENSTRPQRKITCCYPSLMKCWNSSQITPSIDSLMGIPDIIKSQSTPMTKVRLLSHAPMELTHTDECRSGYVMLQLLFNGA